MLKSALLALAAALLPATAALAEVPKVVASIKPIHSLVAQVMGELGTPALIVDGAASPHTYSLKPSDAQALQQADLIFWSGHGLERFLEGAIGTLAPHADVVELATAPGITLLPAREGGMFEPHADEAGEAGHHGEGEGIAGGHDDGEERDLHFFLDPDNAQAMVRAIAQNLGEADPEHAGAYEANAAAAIADLDALTAETEARLAPVRDRPFVVFHDAYQYFEKRFDLNAAGSITVNPELTPGADRVNAIRNKLKTLDAACVFAEPQFDPRVIQVLVEGTSARTATLDPEGAALDPGPGLYRKLIETLADDLLACLS